MDMLGGGFASTLMLAAIVLVGLFAIGLIFSRLYHRASKERSFVRTGLGGQKVVKDGGAMVLPVFHEIIPVNMNTLKLEVMRNKAESLITKDRMRVDIVAAFFVRVIPSEDGIANAAQTLGQRTLHPDALRELVEDKFVDALRSTAATMTMQLLQDQRPEFVQGVQSAVSEDLTKNGLELESVSLTSLDQTGKDFFNPNNAFDAEGLTRLTQETENRRRERNVIEQDTEVAVRQKNLDAEKEKLEIQRQEQFLKLEQEQQIKFRTSEQAALVAARQAEKEREAQQARIDAERLVKEAEIERDRQVRQKSIEANRAVQVQDVEREKVIEVANQDKAIAVAAKSEEQSQAQAKANTALEEVVESEQAIETTRATADGGPREADRADRCEPRGRAEGDRHQGRSRGRQAGGGEPRRGRQGQGRGGSRRLRGRGERQAADQRGDQRAVVGSGQPADQARADPGAAGDHREVGRADEADRRHQDRPGRRSHPRQRGQRTARRRVPAMETSPSRRWRRRLPTGRSRRSSTGCSRSSA